jgi:hypothetical protein
VRLLFISLIYVMLAALCVVVVAAQEFYTPIQAQVRAFNAAKARWDAEPIRHYRIRVRTVMGARLCEQDIAVRDAKVVAVFFNRCGSRQYFTVDYLFEYLHSRLPRTTTWANHYGCDVWMSRSTFDPKWGIPLKIDIRMESMSPVNLGALKYGRVQTRFIGNSRQCSFVMLLVIPQIEVLSFTPLG